MELSVDRACSAGGFSVRALSVPGPDISSGNTDTNGVVEGLMAMRVLVNRRKFKRGPSSRSFAGIIDLSHEIFDRIPRPDPSALSGAL